MSEAKTHNTLSPNENLSSKKTRKSKDDIEQLSTGASELVKTHMMDHWGEIKEIESIAKKIYEKFIFGGKEHHYQAALEEELRDKNYHVQQEVARMLHYDKENGETIQLPHDIRGREDLVLPRRKLIIELKQTARLTDKEFNQICRYMHERKNYDNDWSDNTRGILINFGDSNLEMWYLCYAEDISQQKEKITRVLICKCKRPSLSSIVDTYDASNIVG